MKIVCLVITILVVLCAPIVFARQAHPVTDTEAQQWREDLRFMASEMPKRHRNLFHTMRQEEFEKAINALYEKIPSLPRHAIIVEMARIVAMVGDGHTNIAPTRDPKIGFRSFPIKLYFFKDGLFVRSARRDCAALLGGKLVRIGNASAEKVYQEVGTIVGRDNTMDIKFFTPFLMTMPEVLHAMGFIQTMESVTVVVEKNGRLDSMLLHPAGMTDLLPPDTDTSWLPNEGWVDMRDNAGASTPLWLKDPQNKFWFEYLPDSRSMYVQFNQVGNKDSVETVEAFSNQLFDYVNTHPVDRFILDLRLNRGGNGYFNHFILLGIIRATGIDQPGKLFAVIGRGTWSAAQFLINNMEDYTNVLFVGEPSGGKVNSYGDSKKIILPHSGITVRVSSLWWQRDERDKRQWIEPRIAGELTSEDYRNNVDPALQAILKYVPKK